MLAAPPLTPFVIRFRALDLHTRLGQDARRPRDIQWHGTCPDLLTHRPWPDLAWRVTHHLWVGLMTEMWILRLRVVLILVLEPALAS